MKALVIGCGYVGKYVALKLASGGHEVHGLRLSGAPDTDLSNAGIRVIKADVSELRDLHNLPPNYEWVINTVASSLGGAEDYRRTYLSGTDNILKWLGGSKIRKYVYTSSTGVYGQDDGSTVDEHSPTEPHSDTGKVLVETEQLLLSAAQAGFPACILRAAGIYGPGRGYWFRQFISGEARVEGDGQRVLNMIHRDDVAGAILAVLERGQPGAVYNVVDDEPVTQLDMFAWLSRELKMPMPPQEGAGASVRRRGATNKRISNSRLRDEIGYGLLYPTFREGMAAFITTGKSGDKTQAS